MKNKKSSKELNEIVMGKCASLRPSGTKRSWNVNHSLLFADDE